MYAASAEPHSAGMLERVPPDVREVIESYVRDGWAELTGDFEDATHPHVKTMVVQLSDAAAVVVLLHHDNVDMGKLASVTRLAKRKCVVHRLTPTHTLLFPNNWLTPV